MRRFSKQTLMLIASVDVNRVVRASGADMAMVDQLVWSDAELGWIATWPSHGKAGTYLDGSRCKL